ncbi:hypothetical protein B0O99DRAFT_720094 [Bisporella sp. PMI_857]|nr:hypothetical protein B0O99DRAFT_720094 [Bisporella sp. PMI_857]
MAEQPSTVSATQARYQTASSTSTASGTTSRLFPYEEGKNEWAYHGNIDYIGDFNCDVDATILDSGYSSFENQKPSPEDLSSPCSPKYADLAGSSFHAYTPSSLEVNHGSAYHGDGQPDLSLNENQDARPRFNFPQFCDDVTGPSPLETWAYTEETHEQLSWRGVEPWTKRRKTSKTRRSKKEKVKSKNSVARS